MKKEKKQGCIYGHKNKRYFTFRYLSFIMSTETKNPKELMEYRHLGRTGLKVSLLSFGAWVKLLKKTISYIKTPLLGKLWWTNGF
jgi:hypothetical protein